MNTNKISLILTQSNKFSKNYRKHMKKNTIIHIFTSETNNFFRNYSKIQEKVCKFPYIYSRNIQIFQKLYKNSWKNEKYTKIKIFHNMTYKT